MCKGLGEFSLRIDNLYRDGSSALFRNSGYGWSFEMIDQRPLEICQVHYFTKNYACLMATRLVQLCRGWSFICSKLTNNRDPLLRMTSFEDYVHSSRCGKAHIPRLAKNTGEFGTAEKCERLTVDRRTDLSPLSPLRLG